MTSPTVLTADTPYIPWGVRQFYEVPAIASITAVTKAELDAGTDLTPQVTEVTGWSQTGSTVESQAFVGAALKLAGPPSIDDSTIVGRQSSTGTDIRDVLPFGYEGYIVVFPDGRTDGRTMDVFKVKVNGNPKSSGLADPATYTANCAILGYDFGQAIPTT